MLISRNAITYGWSKDDSGWRFTMLIPAWLSSSEREGLVQWLQNYAETIRRERPLWDVRVRSTWEGLTLHAYPNRSEAELAARLMRSVQENSYA